MSAPPSGRQLEQSLRSSVLYLAAERQGLEQELVSMEMKMAKLAGSEAASLDEQMAAHRAAIAEIEARQTAERQAAARERAEAEAAARRAALTGRAAELMEAHEAKLGALDEAEAHVMAAVAAINRAIAAEAAERAAANTLTGGVRLYGDLNFSPGDFVARLVGGLAAHLAGIGAPGSLPGTGRVGAMRLPPFTLYPTTTSWREREAKATTGLVEALLQHAKEVTQ